LYQNSLVKKIKIISPPKNIASDKIILISGAGQDVGKTLFSCLIIKRLKELGRKVYALKISPHFHNTKPLKTIFNDEKFILSLEDNTNTGKDSSRMLAAGADESFFLQVQDVNLPEAIQYTMSFVPKEVFMVVESGGLYRFMKPALSFFIQREGVAAVKPNAEEKKARADFVLHFSGDDFGFDVNKLIIEKQIIVVKP